MKIKITKNVIDERLELVLDFEAPPQNYEFYFE